MTPRQEGEDVDIKVLGPGCRNCVTLEARTREALDGLGLDATIEKVTDPAAIAGYGILSTPGLVIDGDVVIAGKVPSVRKLEQLLAR
jgi:small redox-active disulfide protein 2